MSSDASTVSRRGRLALGLIVAAGCLLRGGLIARAAARGPLDDPDNYLQLARSLARGDGFALDGHPTAYRPPLYPIVLVPIVAVLKGRVAWGVAGLHLAAGAGAIVLTASAARRWGLGPGRALVAAAVVAFDPVLIAQGRSVMTETLAAFLTAATLAALARPGPTGVGLGGVLLGLSALCRPSAWPGVLLTSAAALVAKPGTWRERLGRSIGLAAVATAVVAPWAWRNAHVLGEPVWTTTHGGYTLFLANNPVYYDEVVNGPSGVVWTGHNQWLWWDSVNRGYRDLGEPEADRRMRSEALRVIARRPRDFARASAARLGRFWGVAPSGAVYPTALRVASAVWTSPLWLAVVLGLARPGAWAWPRVAAPAAVVGLTLVHAVYWTDQRMRAPLVPALALVASTAGGPFRPSLHKKRPTEKSGAEGA